MARWIVNGWMYRLKDGLLEGNLMDGCMDEWIDGWFDEWMCVGMNGWMVSITETKAV
jgi:hypothetical protein